MLLNFQDALAALGDAVTKPPYKAPPKAPILYIKPRNTVGAWLAHRRAARRGGAAMGASLGVVIGRMACRVPERAKRSRTWPGTRSSTMSCIPHDNYYRPVGPLHVPRRVLPRSARG